MKRSWKWSCDGWPVKLCWADVLFLVVWSLGIIFFAGALVSVLTHLLFNG